MTLRQSIQKLERVADALPDVTRTASDEVFVRCQDRLPIIARDAIVAGVGLDAAKDSENIQAFVDSFVAQNAFPFLRFALSNPDIDSGSGKNTIDDIDAKDIEDWVRAGADGDPLGKEFDGRDAGDSVDRVVKRMIGILDDEARAGEHALNQDKYLPMVLAFVRGGSPAASWIRRGGGMTIINAWVAYVRQTWPNVVRIKLREAWK